MIQIQNYIQLIRVKQWVKNIFIFLPLFFDKQLESLDGIAHTIIAFISFSLVASSIYCYNDILDVHYDRLHEEKKNRPIANGSISIKSSFILIVILIAISFSITLCSGLFELTFVQLAYLLLNIAYSIWLKKIIILDTFIIALSFVLRIIAGGVAAEVSLSYWIVTLVFLLALFLALAKRLDERLMFDSAGIKVRENIDKYAPFVLRISLFALSFFIILFYLAYTLSDWAYLNYQSTNIYYTTILVIMGFARYFLLLFKRVGFGNPTDILLRDHWLKVIVIAWILSFYVIIY